MEIPTVITLATIPPRFNLLAPTLHSLLAQSRLAQAIEIYIPHRFRRFPDWDGVLPEVPAGVTIRRCDEDLGPATKILPACKAHAGQDIDLLFCDDDKIYDRDWHGRFKRTRRDHPDACIVEAGENLPDIADTARPADRLPRAKRWSRKPLAYRIKRVLSLFTLKAPAYANSGYVDIFAGHGGVMVRPNWFDEKAWQIPETVWTVDDPWLSGQLARKDIPIWLNAEVRRMTGTAAGEVDALHDLVEQGHDRVRADIAAIDFLRQNFGIWQPAGEIAPVHARMTETMKAVAGRAAAKS